MEYTKGEWKVRSGFKVTAGEEQTWVADCYPYHEKHPRPRVIEAEANAHLIASAPDLYEALREAQITLRVLQPSGSAVLREIDKALAKAEGK